jgi:alpha-beta hydrolase superfamily lysophospholipase
MNDIDLLYKKSEEIFPEQKKILYGHSLGGNLALNFIIRRNKPVLGLIVTSPWLKLYKQPDAPALFLANILKNFLPALTLSNRLKPEQLSQDQEVVRAYSNDPLVHDRISLKMFYEIHNAGLYAMRNIFKINCPFLLMHGSADKITSPGASQEFVLNTNDKTTFRLWEGQYHELHNELIYKAVFNSIIEWLRANNM